MGALDGKIVAITGASSGIGAATAEAARGGRRGRRAGRQAQGPARRAGRADRVRRRQGARGRGRRRRRGAGPRLRRGRRTPSSAASTARQQRRGDAARPVRGAGRRRNGAGWSRSTCSASSTARPPALPLIRESGGGDIVNVSSVAGRHANAGSSVYNLTKFGVTAFSEALRQEALHSKVRVTCIEPGFVETELQGHNKNPLVLQGLEKMREQVEQPLAGGRHREGDPLRAGPAGPRQHQ